MSLFSGTMPESVGVEHLFDMHIDLAPAQLIPTPAGTRMIVIVERGTFAGERIRGEVLPGGGDWVVVGDDRIGRIDVRITMRTEDDALVYMTNSGVVALGDDGLHRFLEGESIAHDEAYIRSAPLFETGAETYRWMNAVTAIAVNAIGPRHVDYRVFRVL